MRRRFKATTGIAMTLALLFAETVRCFGAEEMKTRGLIVGRTGDTLAVKTGYGNITVVLADSPKKGQKAKRIGAAEDSNELLGAYWGSGLQWPKPTTLRTG